jgi:uncharacterized membrane protein HdeD (DUF308 family)
MTTIIEKFWWALMLRGVLAVAFGVAMVFCGTLSSLGYLFGTFALAQGVLSGLPAFSRRLKGTLLAGIEGAMGILVALLLLIGSSIGVLLWPSVSNVTFLIYIASWMALTGVVALAMLIRLRGESASVFYMGLSSILCLIFTILLVFGHTEGALGNAKILGVFGILYGVALILIAGKAKSRRP